MTLIFSQIVWMYSKIDLSLLQRQSASQEKHGRRTPHFPASVYWVYLRTRGQEALYETCAACALSIFLCYI